MAVNFYNSADSGAPVLEGTAGSLVAVLDACLVNGYGAQPAAGWSIAYTGTNQRVYTMASGGTGFSIFVDDTGPGGAGPAEARGSGWKAPTGLGAGTGQFPQPSQQTGVSTGALVFRKSKTSDSTARPWSVVADGHTFYVFMDTGDNPSGIFQSYSFCFGDFISYSSTDTNNCMIIGRTQENTSNNAYEPIGALNGGNDTNFSYAAGHYVAASWTGVGSAVPFAKAADTILTGGCANGTSGSNTSTIGNGSVSVGLNYNSGDFPYPNGPDGALWLSPLRIVHGGSVRGYLKGLWAPLQSRPLNHDDTFTVASGNLSGKSFVMKNIGSYVQGTQYTGQIAAETSNTWS